MGQMDRNFEINENGHNIRCKLYFNKNQDIKKMIMTCHGFGGQKDNGVTQKFAEKLLSKYKGVGVLAFNWPCHGDDVKKKMKLEDCTTYLQMVIEHVKQQYPIEALYTYSASFGGYMILKYIAEFGNPFHKIALRCPAVNMYEVLSDSVKRHGDLDKMKKGKGIPIGFDRKIEVTAAFLEELKEADVQKIEYIDYADDMIILHGTKDDSVPFEVSEAFAEENIIEFYPVENADHRFRNPASMEFATKTVMEFFQLGK